jgi:3-methyl-2-oxobutanoate hydroxymethyltransferase
MKKRGEKISMLTAYDFRTAKLLDQAGVEGILVGDSMAMVVQGHTTTVPVTLDQLIYHGEMVVRGVERSLVVVDLPFPINHLALAELVDRAGRLLKETGCQAVKMEGGAKQAECIEAMVTAGIPVVAHVGLRPQSINLVGRYRVHRDRDVLLTDARAAQQAGAFAVVVECVPADIAAHLSADLEIPTIGIGAGAGCDGQILVTDDLLGLTTGYVPSFVKQYADLQTTMTDAVQKYCGDVRSGEFPGPDQTFT